MINKPMGALFHPEDARLLNDLDQLAEYIERAVSLGETHTTFQISI